MNTTTPASITASILDFCRCICRPASPVFVSVKPSPEAKVNQCFFNVTDQVKNAGGSMVCGWTIWEWPGLYLEAEHHAVWRDESGTLLDLSPKPDGEMTILFLPDAKARFYVNHPKWRDNFRLATSFNPMVASCLKACADYQKFELRHSVAKGRDRQIRIPSQLVPHFERLAAARYQAMRELGALGSE